MLEATIVKTRRQHAWVGGTQSLDVGITTAIVEMVIMPNIDVVRRGILIGFVAKLDNGLGGVSTGRNLSQNSALPMATTRIIGTP